MKRWLLLLIIAATGLVVTKPASAQGSLVQSIAWRFTPAGAFPSGTATVTICSSSGSGQPCTPAASIFSDSALSVPVSNPLIACTTSPQVGCIDVFGNFAFYIAPGAYTFTITGAGLQAYGPIPFSAPVVNGGSASFTTLTISGAAALNGGGTLAGTFAGAPSFSGNITFAGTLKLSGLTAGRCLQLDGSNNITTAGAACGTSGGTVTITGSPAAGNLGCWSGASSMTNCDLSGDVTTSGSSAATIAALAVTTAKLAANAVTGAKLAAQYTKFECSPGLGDGLNAISAGTYLQFNCVNKSGVTWTITGISCWTDNNGTSSLQAANNAATNLLTGAVTCNNTKSGGGNSGTQSATTTLANNDAITFTFVADGTSKQTTWTVTLTQ